MTHADKSQTRREAAFRQALTDAKRTGRPWFELAELLARGFGEATDGVELQDLQAAAVDAAGYSAGLLKRYVTLLERLTAIAAAAGVPRESIMSPVFNSAEVAARIYDKNPAEGLESLRRLALGELTLQEVRDRLVQAAAAPLKTAGLSDTLVRRAQRERSLLDFMEIKLPLARKLWGPDVTVVRDGWHFIRQHEFVVKRKGKPVAGVAVYDADSIKFDIHIDFQFPYSLLAASFFKTFYVAFSPSSSPRQIERMIGILDFMKAGSIGVFQMHEDGRIEVFRQPKGRPQPDRTSQYDAPCPYN